MVQFISYKHHHLHGSMVGLVGVHMHGGGKMEDFVGSEIAGMVKSLGIVVRGEEVWEGDGD